MRISVSSRPRHLVLSEMCVLGIGSATTFILGMSTARIINIVDMAWKSHVHRKSSRIPQATSRRVSAACNVTSSPPPPTPPTPTPPQLVQIPDCEGAAISYGLTHSTTISIMIFETCTHSASGAETILPWSTPALEPCNDVFLHPNSHAVVSEPAIARPRVLIA
jgi:hypothetical protein